jgi:hypothetical protein
MAALHGQGTPRGDLAKGQCKVVNIFRNSRTVVRRSAFAILEYILETWHGTLAPHRSVVGDYHHSPASKSAEWRVPQESADFSLPQSRPAFG